MDDTTTTTSYRASFLAFAVCVGLAVVIALSTPSAPHASATSTEASPPVTSRVTLWLASNTFLAGVATTSKKLLKPTQSSNAARLAAQRNPQHFSDTEKASAAIADHSRNSALPYLRRAAQKDVNASQRIQKHVHSLGGTIESANPIPNQIVATVPTNAIPKLRRNSSILRVTSATQPIWMNQPIDGSPVWHLNGFTGQGTSLDGVGSPDYVSFDQGTRTAHDAFKTRMPGDCSTCIGSGPSRILSPDVRTDFSGTKHGNVVAATVGATSFNAGMNPTSLLGMAYGIDKIYDNYEAYNPALWDLGISTPRPVGYPITDPPSDPGLGGNTDLPEVINYSAGFYTDNQDLYPGTMYWDSLESNFGILNTISAGNCGIATPSFDGCSDGPHRVSAPGTNYNVLTTGGLDTSTTYPDTSGYIPWANTSPGPTWGGRKKPDLIATVSPTAGTPSAINDTTWTSGGTGTSFASPQSAAGALLLASTGVYDTKAQKAILINSTTPVQGQTYWTPRTGWGALNLETAFPQRGNYALGSITGSGTNSARFYKLTGASVGDRATLVWDRRTTTDSVLVPTYYGLTDLDLSQFDPGTLASTATGGSDAADTVDIDQVVTAANPMPGNGTDGGDNIEQVRSTGTGTQILKVKSLSSVDGATSEPFAIAAKTAPTAVQTPIPTISLATAPTVQGLAQNVTVTATIQNPSADLPLTGATALLTIPGGSTLTTGANPAPLGTIAPNASTTATWTLQSNTSGTKNLSATVSGTAYDENFSGTDTDSFEVDGTAPVVTIAPPPTFSTTTSPTFSWSATDSQSTVANYDVESALDSAPWSPALTATTQTSAAIAGSEGQVVHLRVRSKDTFGNESGWSEVATTIDAAPPTIAFGASQTPTAGTVNVPVTFANVGSPVTSALYSFSTSSGAPSKPVTSAPATFISSSRATVTATLIVAVTDAAGHTATKAQAYTVPPSMISANLQISKPKIKSRTATIKGTINSASTGKVTLTVRRKGKTGTKKLTKKASISRGKYTAKAKLKKGKYTVTATFPGSTGITKATTKRMFTVR